MSLEKLVSKEIKTIYYGLTGTLGFYRIRPGESPYICLSTRLLEESEDIHKGVFQVLLDHHKSIPADSAYRLFQMCKYFEELVPKGHFDLAPAEPQMVIEVRAWRLTPETDRVRIIGNPG